LLASLAETHRGTIVGQDLAVLGEHEDGHLGLAYFRSAVMFEAITQ
jgi:hypothetical protein